MGALSRTAVTVEDLEELPAKDSAFDGTNDLTKDYDVIIKTCDGEQLHVHSLIMSKWSSVIRAMPFVEVKAGDSTPNPNIVNVEEDSEIWREMLGLLYPVIPVTVVDWDNVDRIFHLADKYDMPGILERCERFLLGRKSGLSNLAGDSNYVLRWLAFASKFDQESLKEKCMQHIRTNHRMIDELKYPREGGILKAELATNPAGVECIVELMAFVMQQRR